MREQAGRSEARLGAEAGLVEAQQDLDLAVPVDVDLRVVAEHTHNGRVDTGPFRRRHLEEDIRDTAADLRDLHSHATLS